MSPDLFVMTRGGETFRRSVRDEKKKVVKTLVFNAGQEYPLDDFSEAELAAFRTDIGLALKVCARNERGRVSRVEDWETVLAATPAAPVSEGLPPELAAPVDGAETDDGLDMVPEGVEVPAGRRNRRGR